MSLAFRGFLLALFDDFGLPSGLELFAFTTDLRSFALDTDFLPSTDLRVSRTTMEPQPPTSCTSVEAEPQPSTSCPAVEAEPQPSTSYSAADDQIEQSSDSFDEDDAPPAKRHFYVSEVLVMWNLVKIYRQLGTREQAIAFAEEKGMLPKQKLCNYHKKPMSIEYSTNKTVGSFVCNRGPCRAKSKVSRGKGTWFNNINIALPQVFYLMYAFVSGYSYDQTIKEDFSEGEHRLSTATINDWFYYCREAIVVYKKHEQELKGKIGGPGKVVQIDESKFGKRKYNKGRQVEGHWILGMIEDGSVDLRLEVCPENNRSAEVLVPLIKKHVAEGTIIHTDFWRAYDCLGDHGYIHKKVNHSAMDNPFVAEDGTHTQRIESQWRVMKRFFVKDNYNNRTNMNDLIYEYLWRTEVQRIKKDPFDELINVINYGFHK